MKDCIKILGCFLNVYTLWYQHQKHTINVCLAIYYHCKTHPSLYCHQSISGEPSRPPPRSENNTRVRGAKCASSVLLLSVYLRRCKLLFVSKLTWFCAVRQQDSYRASRYLLASGYWSNSTAPTITPHCVLTLLIGQRARTSILNRAASYIKNTCKNLRIPLCSAHYKLSKCFDSTGHIRVWVCALLLFPPHGFILLRKDFRSTAFCPVGFVVLVLLI